MEAARNRQASLLMWSLVAGLLSQNLLIPVMSAAVSDQKNYYPPDPHGRRPPRGGSRRSPSHGHVPSPSHGRGSYGGVPPSSNCGNPPSGGGGHYEPTPVPPTHYNSPPITGGGSPPTPIIDPPTPITVTPPISGGGHYDPTPAPPTPTGGGGGYYNSPPIYGGGSPPTPIVETPPVTLTPTPTPIPGTPTTPGISVPSPPYGFDPNTPPFTCIYWKSHPGLIWGLLGWFGTVGRLFGVTGVPGFGGSNLSLQQALSNTRTDGYGELYREGTASLLNSMIDRRFPYTTEQVKDSFVSAISSNKAAAAQAKLFKLANEGRVKPRA